MAFLQCWLFGWWVFWGCVKFKLEVRTIIQSEFATIIRGRKYECLE